MTNAVKTPDQIEREADQARSQLKQTVDALSARLSPGQLLDQVMGMTKEHGGAFAKNLGGQVKQNPLALLLTGIGALWLMIGSGRQQPAHQGSVLSRLNTSTARHDADVSSGSLKDKLSDNMQSTKTSVHNTTSSLKASALEQKEKLKSQTSQTKAQLSNATDSVKDSMTAAKHSAQDMAASTRETAAQGQEQLMAQAAQVKTQFDSLMRDQPLIAGALGVALGAAIGALVPPTEKEDQLLGRHSDSLKAKALSEADKQYDAVRDTVTKKAEEVSASVDRSVDRSGTSRVSQQHV